MFIEKKKKKKKNHQMINKSEFFFSFSCPILLLAKMNLNGFQKPNTYTRKNNPNLAKIGSM